VSTRPGPDVGGAAIIVLDALAQHISTVLDAFYDFGVATGWQPTADSAMKFEEAALTRQYGPDAYWDGTDAAYASSASVIFTAVAGQHLEGIRTLLDAREVTFTLATPTRAVLEIAGHVHWLLDPRLTGSGASVRDRAARVFLARLDNSTRAKTAAKAVQHPDTKVFARSVRDLRKVVLPSRFYPSEIKIEDSGKIELRRQVVPGLGASLRYIEEVNQTEWNTPGMYAYLSNASHPTLHVPLEMINPNARPGFHLEDVTLPYRLTRAAMMSFIKCWALSSAYLGLDQEQAGDLGEQIDALPTP
jgi:hypothetical protein